MIDFKPFLLLLFMCVISSVSDSAEFEAEVPIDLAKALIELPAIGNVRFFEEPPDSFPEMTIPAEFVLVGSMTMDLSGYSRTILKSQLSLNDGMPALIESLQNDGYSLVPKMPLDNRGFTVAESLPTTVGVCSDEKGSISIRAMERGLDYFYSVHGSRIPEDSRGDNCSERIARQNESVARRVATLNSGVRGLIPEMVLPSEQNTNYRGLYPSSRGRGSDDYYETSSQVRSSFSANDIYSHFAEQLVSQGWTIDEGGDVSESTWQLDIEVEQEVFGELFIEQVDEDMFNLRFRISTQEGLYIQEQEDSRIRRNFTPTRLR